MFKDKFETNKSYAAIKSVMISYTYNTFIYIYILINLALVESVISYGIVACGGAFDNVLIELQICQSRILKVILIKKNQRFPTETQ